MYFFQKGAARAFHLHVGGDGRERRLLKRKAHRGQRHNGRDLVRRLLAGEEDAVEKAGRGLVVGRLDVV